MADPAALEASIALLPPAARRLLWIISRALPPVPETLVEKVWSGESVEEEKLRSIGRMMAALERVPAESRPKAPPMPDDVRARIAELEARAHAPHADIEPLVGDLVAARLCTRGSLTDGGEAMGFSFTPEVADAIAAWMNAHPEERDARDEAQIRVAFGERYGAALLAALEGQVPGGTKEAGIEAGSRAVDYMLAAGAHDALAALLGGAVRAANDAEIVGPVVAAIEDKGALEATTRAMAAKGDALGEAGTLSALAGFRKSKGEIDGAIALEAASLAALARADSPVGCALVHLRLSGYLDEAGRADDAAKHHLAALLYRAIAGSDFSAEIRALVERMGRGSYALPPVATLVADEAFAPLRAFLQSRRVPVVDVQADVDALVGQVKRHLAG
ncbi:hypothetical protein [Polyangium aurulentum]|uniref:hypothetical protein n=1 Tax=Polyangium aurulentum TaxID=2567896 RepID=UPI0010ADB34A|nr:hypothetical protein [Polyangium aurulentum]UQA54865.1 hypothetical protein E8A73_026240 [Polyangium aurulentum]